MRTITSMSLLSCLCLALLLSHGFARESQPSRAHRLSRKLQQDSSNWSPWWDPFNGGNPWFRPPQQGNSPGNPWNPVPPGCVGEVHPGNPYSYSFHCGQGSSGSSTSPPSRSIPVPAVPGGSTGLPPSPPSPSNGGQFPPRGNPIPPGCRGVYHEGNPSWWTYSCDGDNGYSPPSTPGSSTPSAPGYGQGIDFPGIQYLPPWLRDWLRNPTSPFPHPPFGN